MRGLPVYCCMHHGQLTMACTGHSALPMAQHTAPHCVSMEKGVREVTFHMHGMPAGGACAASKEGGQWHLAVYCRYSSPAA